MKEMKNGVFTYDGESINFDFKTSLSAYEKMIFVKTVVESIVDNSGYDFIIKDLIFDFTIIDVFTNIDTSFIEIKDNDGNDINPIIPIEHFLMETNVVDIVKENMEIGLLEELNRAVNFDIQYLTGINPNPVSEALANLLSTIEKKINGLDVENMMGIVQKFASMTEEFTAENVVNAYMNSDVHKKNLEDIKKAKKQKTKSIEKNNNE